MAGVGYLTSATLIDTVKREAMVPSSQSTLTNADFLAFANQEMRIGIVPSLMQYHQEYYVRDSAPIPITANVTKYPIPTRAVGGKFREIYYLDSNNNLRAMTRISPDDRAYYQQTSFQNRFLYFFLQGNDVVMVPDVGPSPTGSLVFSFWIRPNELVDVSRVATIQSFTTTPTTTTYTLDMIPAGFTSGVLYDFMQTAPGHKTISYDITPISIDTVNKQMTFTTTATQTLAIGANVGASPVVGDYISFAGECIIPQAPADLHDVLAQRVSMRCLQALGDQAGYGIAQAKLTEMEKNIAILTDNRSEGSPVKANNMRSLLRTSKLQRRWS